MRYKSFRIRNFKGIKDTTINLEGIGGASVFAFVGLNESGKTTILEAIHSFSPDAATSELLAGEEGTGVPYKDRVPRHLISTFTGYVSVLATLEITDSDKKNIIQKLKNNHNISIDLDRVDSEIILERQQQFKDGDFIQNYFSIRSDIKIRKGKQKTWKLPAGDDFFIVRNIIYELTPSIAYFPTFVFEFPETAFLTDRGGTVDRFYRRVFQDILDYDGHGHTIEKDIVRRIRGETLLVPWLSFLALWAPHDDRAKIQHVMDRASAAVTRLVFGRWNKIFGEDTRGKEVIISFDISEGEKRDSEGKKIKTHEHDVYISFQIRDGTRRFNVNDRSLGFRWFFAFMLFTQFRVARSISRPLLFLFDEPASNLHAAAQQKLIDCFPESARGQHMLAYTTHSHYMIEPKWLEQTFIVTNRSDSPSQSILDNLSLEDESLDIKAATYRSFVNEHPNQTSYFQPIIDRLEIKPSRFDITKSSIILEGRSDYYILRYAAKMLEKADLPLVPGLGAGTFGGLAALHIGWGLDFLFVLDGDRQGKSERDRYIVDYGISSNRIITIDSLVSNVNTIEDLLDAEAINSIQSELKLNNPPTKSQIKRFFQERLASENVKDLGKEFRKRSKMILEKLQEALAS